MADRNRTAAWIRYPLPQPAASPLNQADKQQFMWNFRLTVTAAAPAAPTQYRFLYHRRAE